nr:uncharacterized protein LOC109165257 [Ipomoea batatas]
MQDRWQVQFPLFLRLSRKGGYCWDGRDKGTPSKASYELSCALCASIVTSAGELDMIRILLCSFWLKSYMLFDKCSVLLLYIGVRIEQRETSRLVSSEVDDKLDPLGERFSRTLIALAILHPNRLYEKEPNRGGQRHIVIGHDIDNFEDQYYIVSPPAIRLNLLPSRFSPLLETFLHLLLSGSPGSYYQTDWRSALWVIDVLFCFLASEYRCSSAAMLLLNHHSRQSHHHSSSSPNVTVSQVKASVEKWVSGILNFQQRLPEKQPTPDRKMESAGKAVQNGSGGAH